jgi:hypothetical protein
MTWRLRVNETHVTCQGVVIPSLKVFWQHVLNYVSVLKRTISSSSQPYNSLINDYFIRFVFVTIFFLLRLESPTMSIPCFVESDTDWSKEYGSHTHSLPGPCTAITRHCLAFKCVAVTLPGVQSCANRSKIKAISMSRVLIMKKR